MKWAFRIISTNSRYSTISRASTLSLCASFAYLTLLLSASPSFAYSVRCQCNTDVRCESRDPKSGLGTCQGGSCEIVLILKPASSSKNDVIKSRDDVIRTGNDVIKRKYDVRRLRDDVIVDSKTILSCSNDDYLPENRDFISREIFYQNLTNPESPITVKWQCNVDNCTNDIRRYDKEYTCFENYFSTFIKKSFEEDSSIEKADDSSNSIECQCNEEGLKHFGMNPNSCVNSRCKLSDISGQPRCYALLKEKDQPLYGCATADIAITPIHGYVERKIFHKDQQQLQQQESGRIHYFFGVCADQSLCNTKFVEKSRICQKFNATSGSSSETGHGSSSSSSSAGSISDEELGDNSQEGDNGESGAQNLHTTTSDSVKNSRTSLICVIFTTFLCLYLL